MFKATINSDGSMTVEEKRLFSFGASGIGSSGAFPVAEVALGN
jgi:hypothetical protein